MVEKFDSAIGGLAILSSEIEKNQRKTLSRMSAKIEEMLRGSLRDDGEPRSSGPQMKRDYGEQNNRNTVVQDEMLESMDDMNKNLSEILLLLREQNRREVDKQREEIIEEQRKRNKARGSGRRTKAQLNAKQRREEQDALREPTGWLGGNKRFSWTRDRNPVSYTHLTLPTKA